MKSKKNPKELFLSSNSSFPIWIKEKERRNLRQGFRGHLQSIFYSASVRQMPISLEETGSHCSVFLPTVIFMLQPCRRSSLRPIWQTETFRELNKLEPSGVLACGNNSYYHNLVYHWYYAKVTLPTLTIAWVWGLRQGSEWYNYYYYYLIIFNCHNWTEINCFQTRRPKLPVIKDGGLLLFIVCWLKWSNCATTK